MNIVKALLFVLGRNNVQICVKLSLSILLFNHYVANNVLKMYIFYICSIFFKTNMFIIFCPKRCDFYISNVFEMCLQC